MKIRSCLGSAAAVILTAAAVFIWSNPPLDAINNRSRVLYDEEHNILSYTLSAEDTFRFYCTKEEVDPLFISMLISSEDKRFFSTIGVDPLAIGRALWSNLSSFKTVSGASTLAMQVVRMLEHNDRTVLSKIREALGAIILTVRYGHEDVLNMYLTLAPFGGNIEGVKAASLKWFGHLPNHLSPAECALLVALPRAPEAIRPDRHEASAQYYRNDVLRLAISNKVIKPDVGEAALMEKLPTRLLPIKRSAFHLGVYAFAHSNKKEIYTTISPGVQTLLNILGEKYAQNRSTGGTLSAVVIDDKKREIKGYLGAAVFSDSQLDLPHAVRSPGSALKPFCYAMAFEHSLLHPKSIVADKEKIYGSWLPSNFSKSFQGELTAQDALRTSLNLPALEILSLIGPDNFYSRLNRHKRRIFLPKGAQPQLSLVLGGCSVNLVELTELYAMLNRDGIYVKDRIFTDEPLDEDFVMLERNSSRAVFNILRTTPRPQNYQNETGISYKTGTSFHYRDAWALGSLGSYTAGIWTGRPDNQPDASRTGLESAAPVLFELLTRLKYEPYEKAKLDRTGALSPDPPPSLRRVLSRQRFSSDLQALYLDFPLEGSIITTDSDGYVHLKIRGGVEPFYLTVNGVPQEDSALFRIEKEGSYRIVLYDSAGHNASATVDIRPLRSTR